MQVVSGWNVVLVWQPAGWPAVEGFVASHAAYCDRVTSVTSMENPAGSCRNTGAGKPFVHCSFGPIGAVHCGLAASATPASPPGFPLLEGPSATGVGSAGSPMS